MTKRLPASIALLLLSGAAFAQTKFEAADVHVSPPGTRQGDGGFMPGGRIELRGRTMLDLISDAYGVDDANVVGGPPWLNSDRFDVIAKTAAAVPFENLRGMLKALIVERFALVTHSEEQPMPVYVLEAGKKPKLKETDGAERSECKIVNTDRRYYVCKNTTMAQFAELLPTVAGGYVHAPLLDLTGLKGAYDFQLYWTPRGALSNATAKAAADAASTPVDEFTLYEAVDKQLGLKLEEQKHPVPVLVIDKVERTPAEK